MKETRSHLVALLGYIDVFGEDSNTSAIDLIRDLPSLELIRNVSWINFMLFINEGRDSIYPTQIALLTELLKNASNTDKEIFTVPFEKFRRQNGLGMYFNRKSNLKMYDLIFTAWNHSSPRTFTSEESVRFLKAFLLINTEILANIKIDDEAFEKAKNSEDEMTELMMAKFIHQLDYTRNHDFVIQTARGSLFFDYLSNSVELKDFFYKYLKWLRVENGDEYLYNIIMLITIALPGSQYGQKSQIVNLGSFRGKINFRVLSRLAINNNVLGYIASENFTTLRKYPIFYCNNMSYVILDMTFLIDKLYRNFVFTFKEYIESQGYIGNFLSTKGKKFTEEILFYTLILRCFKQGKYKLFSGKMIEEQSNVELCDYYIRSNNNIALIELKDVLLDFASKNIGTTEGLFPKMDLKFQSNQASSPKGVKQLALAIEKISSGISFDELDSSNYNIYPIITYTDSTFGFNGVNRRYEKLFREILPSLKISDRFTVKPLVFINISFFEFFENALHNEMFDFFSLVDEYYEHIKKSNYEIVPFEVFVGGYVEEKGIKTGLSKLGQEKTAKIVRGR
ncbi:MAG TPA: hypothetical protein VK783_02025 [Bacteroidia bacterium]|jgi:hypothetical protein|nr:hypothetical protein [Bacteroidia bacterium]